MFNVGDKVVCIDASMQLHTVEELRRDVPNWVKQGQQYTIRDIVDSDFVVGVRLEEITNPMKYFKLIDKYMEPAFGTFRFRKLETAPPIAVHVEQEELISI